MAAAVVRRRCVFRLSCRNVAISVSPHTDATSSGSMPSVSGPSRAAGEAPWATALHSQVGRDEAVRRELAVAAGAYPLTFVCEKRATSPRFKEHLVRMHRDGVLLFVAVDEAHCISMWGPGFREDYLRLGGLRQCVPGVPFLALLSQARAT